MTPLWLAAEKRWGGRHCPCCGVPFRRKAIRPNRPTPRDEKTRGHVDAVALGGDQKVWLHICRGCNNDQGSLSFAGFARMLLLRGDRRAERVVEVARFVQPWRKVGQRPIAKQEEKVAIVDEASVMTRETFERAVQLMDERAARPRDTRLFVSPGLYDAWVAEHGSAPPYWVRLSSDRMPRS